MSRSVFNDLGRITLSEEVISTIAGLAASECPGIAGMASSKLKDGLADLLGRENLTRGIEVKVDQDRVDIMLNIVVGYGARINEVAQEAKERVRKAVEEATELRVTRVDINVQGVKLGGPR